MTILGLKASYSLKHALILCCIIADLSLNTVIDSRAEKITSLILMGIQAAVRIMSLFIMLASMWNTFVFKYGLIGQLCSRFKFLVAFFPFSFMFLAALRIMRAAALFKGDDVITIWNSNTYQAIYVIHNLLSIAYYVALLQASFDLGNPSFYKASTWLER